MESIFYIRLVLLEGHVSPSGKSTEFGPYFVGLKVVGSNKSESRMPNKLLTASKAYSTYIKVIISYIYVRNKLYLRLYFGSYSLEFPESYPEVVGFIYYRARTGDGCLILLNLNL